ncbi:phosphohistidine phosphatase SixA [Neptuniibacter sp. QD34_54]|uniref:phosphohistidine phosphatase SixA n=1 Tax=Neptuniibacter sp. QD34_54 TaxID=3398208 RepID=UPI0039F5491C
MNFFLMRHGEAEFFAESDAQRKLTPEGVERLRSRLKTAVSYLKGVDCVIHSPYVRACQTAEIVNQQLGGVEQFVSELWTPESNPANALAFLESFESRSPLVVTHMPLISYVEAICCEGSAHNPAAFSCGEIAQLEADWPAAGLGRLVRRI